MENNNQNYQGQPNQGQYNQNYQGQPNQGQYNQNYQGQPNQGTNNYTYNNTYVNNYPDNRPVKSKIAAGILFILLGDIGIGNFYMGKIGLGILDIVFCWTGIPAIVNLIRGIIILCGSDESFENKYNVRVG